MKLRSNNKTKVEGGMASMTDLVFLLLIFFIIMSITSKHIELDLPKTSESIDTKRNPVQPTVLVLEDDQYVYLPGGDIENPMSFDEVKELAAQGVMDSGETKLKVAGHRNANYEAVFKVLALCQANGWDPALSYKD